VNEAESQPYTLHCLLMNDVSIFGIPLNDSNSKITNVTH
jgi:hypothetical protein